MKFYEVLKSVMEGNKAYRKGWDGKNMFIYLERGSVIPKSKINNDTLRFSLTDKEVTINPHIDLKNSKGELQVGWSPSQEDLLADDWQDFYFQDKNKPIDTIHGGFVYPDSIEEMHNSILDILQDLFEESDVMEASRKDIGIPLNEALVVAMNNWDMGYLTYTLVTLPKDSPLGTGNSTGTGVISIDNIMEYIYNNVSNIGTPYKFRDFLNNPERVIYEIVKDKVKDF